jgi:hypothetical protein
MAGLSDNDVQGAQLPVFVALEAHRYTRLDPQLAFYLGLRIQQ